MFHQPEHPEFLAASAPIGPLLARAWRAIRVLLALLVLAGGAVTDARAMAEGCGDSPNTPMGRAVRAGSPDDLVRVIEGNIAYFEARLRPAGPLSFLGRGMSEEQKQAWRAEQWSNYLTGVYKKPVPCGVRPPLTDAVHAGNLDVVRFLLARPRGVDVPLPYNFLEVCRNAPRNDPVLRARRKQAVALVIDAGLFPVNLPGKQSRLLACDDPDISALLVERGSKLDLDFLDDGRGVPPLTLLERAVITAVESGGLLHHVPAWYAVDRVKVYIAAGMDVRMSPAAEAKIARACTTLDNGEPRNDSVCRAMAELVRAAPGTFSSPAGTPQRVPLDKRGKPSPYFLGFGNASTTFEAVDLPPDLLVVAAGVTRRRTAGERAQDGTQEAIRYVVNVRAERPIALVLQGDGAATWTIRAAPRTRIAAIYVNGFGRQAVEGVPESVAVIANAFDRFPVSHLLALRITGIKGNDWAGPAARYAFGRDADAFYPVEEGGSVDIVETGRPPGPDR